MIANQEMAKAFAAPSGGSAGGGSAGGGGAPAAAAEAGGGGAILIILTDEKGISPADEDVYRKLVDKLKQDTQDKVAVQDFLTTPQLREVLASKDGKAFNLPVSVPGEATAPSTIAAFKRIRAITKQVTDGTSLTAHLTGPIATVSDATDIGFEDMDNITIGTIVAVLSILFVIYRNVVTMLVPLLLIAACIGLRRASYPAWPN